MCYFYIKFFIFKNVNHIQECKVYTPNKIINSVHGSRFKRDNIYFVIFKSANGKVYSVELSETESSNVYTPKSMKINDSHLDKCSEIEMTFIRAERIRPPRKRKNKKTTKKQENSPIIVGYFLVFFNVLGDTLDKVPITHHSNNPHKLILLFHS